MLFSKVYNWIKYKTLPPSFLFLNRLFVERDSKHRRITSNLGLTFRNSKWSSYARTNTNIAAKRSYFTSFLRFLAFLALVIVLSSFREYYDFTSIFSPLYTVLWFLVDTDLYLKALLVSSFLCLLQASLRAVYSYALSGFSAPVLEAPVAHSDASNFSLPSRLHKPIVYSWLVSRPFNSDFEKFFESRNAEPSTLSVLYKSLFLSTHLVHQTNNLFSTPAFLSTLCSTLNPKFSQACISGLLSSQSAKSQLISLEYCIFSANSSVSSSYFSKLSNWTLDSLQSELKLSKEGLVSTRGLFYWTNLTNSELTSLTSNWPELGSLRPAVDNQLSVIRWNRWLYKYNLLHRSALKHTSRLTSAKRLIGTGFYDSSLTSRNLWAASTLSDNVFDAGTVGILHRKLYGDYSGLYANSASSIRPSFNFYQSADINLLNFYENSYHWSIQRFYKLSTLSCDSTLLSPLVAPNAASLSVSSFSETATPTFERAILSSDLLKTSPSQLRSVVVGGENESGQSDTSSSDTFLSYYDYTLFSKARTETLRNIVKTSRKPSLRVFYPSKLGDVSVPTSPRN